MGEMEEKWLRRHRGREPIFLRQAREAGFGVVDIGGDRLVLIFEGDAGLVDEMVDEALDRDDTNEIAGLLARIEKLLEDNARVRAENADLMRRIEEAQERASESPIRLTRGQVDYEAREAGAKWLDLGGAAALQRARAYAKSRGKPWPVVVGSTEIE